MRKYYNFVDDTPVITPRTYGYRNAVGKIEIEDQLNPIDEADSGGNIGGGGSSPATPPPPAPAPSTNCTGSASLTQISNTGLPSGVRSQSFRVGSCVNGGFNYFLEVYSHPVPVSAVSGDTPSSIASKLAAAVNGTTAIAWNSAGAAPKNNPPGFKPSASFSGDVVTVVLNYSNQFAGYATGSYSAPEPAPVPTPAAPPEPEPVIPPPADEPTPPPPAPVVSLPPVAVIQPISPVTLPNNVITLNGNDSYDADDEEITFSWQKISGPSGDNILSPTGSTSQVTGLAVGTYIFRLTVEDESGNTDTEDITVNVSAAAVNLPPIANAGANQTIYLPTNEVLLNGSNSSDPEAGPLTYSWAWIAGPTEPTMTDPAKAVCQVSELVEGQYDFRLTVMDVQGNTDESMTKVFVMPPEKELIYKTSILGGPYAGGGGAGGGGGSSAGTPATNNKVRNLLILAVIAIGVSFLFFKKDTAPK